MIRINYNENTGDIIGAYGNKFESVPSPFIDVENEVWSLAFGKPKKVVDGKLVVDNLSFLKKIKLEENEKRKNEITKLQIILGGKRVFLLLDTPTMPLPNIMLAFKEFQQKNVPLPANSFRYYNEEDSAFSSPELSPKEVDILYWQMFFKYSAIDEYNSRMVKAINDSVTEEQLSTIIPDYSLVDAPLTDQGFAYAQSMAAIEESFAGKIVFTQAAQDAGCYIEVDFKDGTPIISVKQK